MCFISVVSDPGAEVSAEHPRVPELGGGQAEGRLRVPDRARHRDRDQALPRGAERHRQAARRQHRHAVRRQLRHALRHLPVQG